MIHTNLQVGIYQSDEVRNVFSCLKKEDLDRLPESLFVKTENACFKIDFLKNRVVTHLNHEKKKIDLHNFLSVLSKKGKQLPESTHLYDPVYVKAICPKMGYPIGVEALQKGIRTLYIGRCILGLGKSIDRNGYHQETHRSEFMRIARIIKGIEPIDYSSPLV